MQGYLYYILCQHFRGMAGASLCIMFLLSACSSVEYVPPKRFYKVDKTEFEASKTNVFNLYDMQKGRSDKQEWGEFHFATKDPQDEAVTMKIRKEKNEGPSRYKAETHIPALDMKSYSGTTDFSLSYDRDRKMWMGFELRFRKNLWSPAPAFAGGSED